MHFVADEAECEALGTEEIYQGDFMFFPNPVKDKLTVLNPDLKISKIEITDVTGKRVYTQNITSEKVEIDLKNLPKGLYFLSAISKDGMMMKKIVKS